MNTTPTDPSYAAPLYTLAEQVLSLCRASGAHQAVGFVGQVHVRSPRIGIGIDGDGPHPEPVDGTDRPGGDLPAVCNQNFFDHESLLYNH